MDWTGQCVEDGVATIRGITCLIGNILKPLPGIIVLAALGMVIYSGIKMVNAGADSKAYGQATQTFQFAVVGLVMLSGAWLVLILIERFTGARVTQFGLPSL